ncbi:hypothetical protein F8388_020531 [Cannabis sativa]|uniref:DRBM domain-containing protein n=1 Tax=Cannabis sativa TaxID=3483 RepID=A0A7J6ERD8_CANSA|nr:hypothetical protein F8388_020531 [Cannabis sativa]
MGSEAGSISMISRKEFFSKQVQYFNTKQRKRKRMYKSKLQELCHKNQWGLPKYTSMRYGPDHNPLFGASAEHAVATPMVEESNQNLDIRSNVSGLKSGKELQLNSSTIIKTNKGERSIEEKLEILKMQSDDLGISVGDGEETKVKKQLQKYARQRNFGLPVYFCECDQCPEATQFMATVTVGDQIFESSGSFNTSKDAESDTAKDESRVYKNLLQELVQREDLSTPLDGEIFHGKAAKSKKQAELDAARAAYVALQERGSIQNVNFTSSSLGAHTPKSTWSSCVAYDLGQSLKHQCILVPHQPQIYVEAKEKFGTLADSAETTVSILDAA